MMKLSEILRLVWVNIVQNKSRMLMTSLGIVVGAATVVMVLAIGKGGQADVADQFKNLNAGAIEVTVGTGFDMDAMMMDMMGGMPGGMGSNMPDMSGGGFSMPSMSGGGGGFSMPSMGGGSSGRSGGSGMPSMSGAMGGGGGSMGGGRAGAMPDTRMTQDDVADIATYVSNLQEVTIYQSDSVSVFGGVLEVSTNATVVGALEGYQNVSNLNVLYGRFLSDEDDAYADYVAVIGYDLAAELFEYAAMAYGDFIQIDDKNYEIVGVLERMGSVTSGISPDSAVFIPYSTAEKHVFGSTLEPTIAAVANDVDNVEQCMADIEAVLTENHPNAFFDVTDAGAAMEAASSSANTLAMLLFAVAPSCSSSAASAS